MLESEFLKPDFLEKILQEFPELVNGHLKYEIYGSNRKWSRTIYIKFFMPLNYNHRIEGKTLRISNHRHKKNVHKQFIIDTEAEIVGHRMDVFKRTVQNCINETRQKILYFSFKRINKNGNNKPN